MRPKKRKLYELPLHGHGTVKSEIRQLPHVLPHVLTGSKLRVRLLIPLCWYIWPVENTVGVYRENEPVFSSYASNTFKLYQRGSRRHITIALNLILKL